MIKSMIMALCVLLTGCNGQREMKTECDNSVIVNETKICLPKLKGFTDVSNNNNYDDFKTVFEKPDNKIIGFYVENSALNKVEKPKYNFALIYVNSKLQKNINLIEFKQISKNMGSYFKKGDFWETIIKEVENNYLKNISFDQPVLIDDYSLNSSVKTYLLLDKTFEAKKETITLTTLNLMHIQDKMVLFNYIIKYNNSNSINEIKQKNDYFTMRLLKLNE